jgi:hypothetical protein
MLLKVKPNKSLLKLGRCTKLTTRLCGLFEILDKIGPIAYILALSTSMNVHNVFHVSLMKKYVHNPNHFIDWNLIQVDPKRKFQVQSVCILDIKVKLICNRVIELVKF